ncbi:ABC transporter ATP-binding protein [Stenomitos frigidus ULC18]|uniref:ABC transporter ATP-binding protein n=2 Tax=Stenomitos TaxID=1844270 RepID=A0A2T1DZX3_9CYAN|nr:ABC transporter ATP-binding protein [Stenomitos frigidus ULC18]
MEPIIAVKGLGKAYQIRTGEKKRYHTLRDDLFESARGLIQGTWGRLAGGKAAPTRTEEFWALKDINLEIYPGEVVGIIGRNGAGKSTLLKILSRVVQPTTGEAVLYGRIASLLEVGTGFHPELTGRENIFMSGVVLGMKQAEVRRKFDEIVAFAEVEKFLDTPVKRYSSGMYVRLAFAVAAHLEPDILLVDEVLAVGDAAFQRKCLGKMEDVAKNQGRTVLFVSHNMGIVTQLCTRGIYLKQGQISETGDINSVVSSYLLSDVANDASRTLHPSGLDEQDKKAIFFRTIQIKNQEGELSSEFDVRYPFYIHLTYEVAQSLKNAELSLRIDTDDGRPVFTTHQSDCNTECLNFREIGVHDTNIKIPAMFLMPGAYLVTIGAHEPMVQVYDSHENLIHFRVIETGTKLAKYQQHQKSGVVMIDLPWQQD